MTQVSDININDTTRLSAVENKDDSSRILYNEVQREQYITEFGNVEVEYDDYYKVYRVAAHKAQRAEARALKLKYCMKYGSN